MPVLVRRHRLPLADAHSQIVDARACGSKVEYVEGGSVTQSHRHASRRITPSAPETQTQTPRLRPLPAQGESFVFRCLWCCGRAHGEGRNSETDRERRRPRSGRTCAYACIHAPLLCAVHRTASRDAYHATP